MIFENKNYSVIILSKITEVIKPKRNEFGMYTYTSILIIEFYMPIKRFTFKNLPDARICLKILM